jgi:hypothetical protein
MTAMIRTVLTFGVPLLLLLGIILARTATYGSARSDVLPAPNVEIPGGAAERLAGAIRFPTVSNEDPAAFDGRAFEGLHAHLEASFPRVHATLRRETVGEHSLLYTWAGSEPSLKPILLMRHLDVVPVEPDQESRWTHARSEATSQTATSGVAGPSTTSRPSSARSRRWRCSSPRASGRREPSISRTVTTRRSAAPAARARSPRC